MVSRVLESSHATIRRENRSIIQERYTNPSLVQIYVISGHHTALGLSGLKSLFKIFLRRQLKSSLMVVIVCGLT